MKYMGSKARHAKEMLPIILKDRKEGQWYVEPFVGGCNMIDKVEGNRIGADVHEYLIAMWQAVSVGWLPPKEFTEEKYKQVKLDLDINDPITAYAGFSLSYGGVWFSAYRRDSVGVRDYAGESYRSAIKQFPMLSGVCFYLCSYENLSIPQKSIIYCDPPYKDTAAYKGVGKFDHEKFYAWCREKHKEGHTVFVSEYWMPDDFKCVWQKQVNSSLTKDTGGKKAVEKLFTLQ